MNGLIQGVKVRLHHFVANRDMYMCIAISTPPKFYAFHYWLPNAVALKGFETACQVHMFEFYALKALMIIAGEP